MYAFDKNGRVYLVLDAAGGRRNRYPEELVVVPIQQLSEQVHKLVAGD